MTSADGDTGAPPEGQGGPWETGPLSPEEIAAGQQTEGFSPGEQCKCGAHEGSWHSPGVAGCRFAPSQAEPRHVEGCTNGPCICGEPGYARAEPAAETDLVAELRKWMTHDQAFLLEVADEIEWLREQLENAYADAQHETDRADIAADQVVRLQQQVKELEAEVEAEALKADLHMQGHIRFLKRAEKAEAALQEIAEGSLDWYVQGIVKAALAQEEDE